MRGLRRPASLRGRVVLGVLATLTVLLIALFVAVDLALAARLRSDLRTRLTDRVSLAEQLDGALPAQQLVDRLKGDGVQAQLCTASSASTSPTCVSPHVVPAPRGGNRPPTDGFGQQPGARPTDRPSARPAAPNATRSTAATINRDGSTLFVHTTLPESGQLLLLSVDGSDVTATIRGLIVLEVIGGLVCLLIAALLLGRVVGVALRPLDQMTMLARRIASGDRGRRLRSRRANTELGRTATAFDAMLDELETALDAAGAAQAQLRQFLGDASHELRSPLAGLQATTELLLRDEPGHAAREQAYVAMIRETRRANRLVDDLLTAARFDAVAAPVVEALALERVDLVEIAELEIGRLRLHGDRLRIHLDGVTHAPVDADPLRLGQIVANLLDNARQATPPGGTVDVHISAGDGGWQLDVRDSGIGVAAADRERIFERLVRLDSSRSRDTGGFGLGLPIARSLARAHGGELRCLPSEHGALFRLTLPSAADQITDLSATGAAPVHANA